MCATCTRQVWRELDGGEQEMRKQQKNNTENKQGGNQRVIVSVLISSARDFLLNPFNQLQRFCKQKCFAVISTAQSLKRFESGARVISYCGLNKTTRIKKKKINRWSCSSIWSKFTQVNKKKKASNNKAFTGYQTHAKQVGRETVALDVRLVD